MTTLRNSFIYSTLLLLISACAMRQSPAPVEQVNTENYGNSGYSNPYGAPPQNNTPYTPPATNPSYNSSNSSYVPPNSTYIPSNAPVDPNAATHTVVYGDTVYNLSKRYQISADDLRAWNGIVDNNIHIGQILRVKANASIPVTQTASSYTPPPPQQIQQPASTVQTAQPVQSAPQSSPSVATNNAPAPETSATNNTSQYGNLTWSRPVGANNAVLTPFGSSNKGIEYGGKMGDPVYAAADGRVIYSGSSGLKGHGNLIVIQHNKAYISAYSNNDSILAKQGETVKRGQKIANMGNSGTNRVQLHFEIRENGNPINPDKFIK
ncbi:MAG: peptidoglycan DD-metalloendopeptidase family protein [Neisseriaceae bacterium]|nr:peptidoglycan DD-metalloendopeptidase family protein [Neisseriaceae bacterium]